MTVKKIMTLASALALFGVLGTANAANISLTPASVDTTISGLVSFDVIMDFSDVTTIGGGFDIVFDSSILSFIDWMANPVGDPAFARAPDIFDGLLSGIGVGDFSFGITGVLNLGTVVFEAIGTGNTFVGTQDTLSNAGPFVDFATFQVVPVNYGGADVNVVPVPAALWLLFGGLGALLGFGRTRA